MTKPLKILFSDQYGLYYWTTLADTCEKIYTVKWDTQTLLQSGVITDLDLGI